MTALEFLKSGLFPNIDNFDVMSVTKTELIDLLQQFALLKCAEQREICAEYAERIDDSPEAYVTDYIVDKDSILNAPNPEM